MECHKNGKNQSKYSTEKLLLRAYHSAYALKNEIRDRIQYRKNGKWNFCGMRRQGAFILLCFTKKDEKNTNIENQCECFQCA